MLKIITITAGVTTPSTTELLGQQLADATRKTLAAQGEQVEIIQVSLGDLAKPLTDFFSLGFASGQLAVALDHLRKADAVITVTPTFKASYSGLFKMFWDIVDDQDVHGKPVLLAATGGTARHSLMVEHSMRPLFAYLRMHIMPTAVFAATDDYGADLDLQPRINRAAQELAHYLSGTYGYRPTSGNQLTEKANKPNTQETLNAGSFFGIAGQKRPGLQAAQVTRPQGSVGLSVTPFEELLRAD